MRLHYVSVLFLLVLILTIASSRSYKFSGERYKNFWSPSLHNFFIPRVLWSIATLRDWKVAIYPLKYGHCHPKIFILQLYIRVYSLSDRSTALLYPSVGEYFQRAGVQAE